MAVSRGAGEGVRDYVDFFSSEIPCIVHWSEARQLKAAN